MSGVKHVVRVVAVIGWMVGLGACGDNNGVSVVDVLVDTPPVEGPAVLAIDHTSNPFGNVVVGNTSAAATFTITNTGEQASGVPVVSLGAGAGEFVLTNACTAALVPGGTCSVTVAFRPTSAGAKTTTLSVGAMPGGMVTATLDGTGLAPGALSLTVTPTALGSVLVGETSKTTALVTVTNNGDVATGVLALQIAGADPVDFTTSDDDCTGETLDANESCTVRIALAPKSRGAKAGTLHVRAAPGGAVDASVTGTGLAPANLIASPLHRNFGSLEFGIPSAELEVLVTNIGDVPSAALTTEISGPDSALFATTPNGTCSGALAAGTTCSVHVMFTPDVPGRKSAQLEISGDTQSNPIITLAGNGITTIGLLIAPSLHSFGTVNVGATVATQQIQIISLNNGMTGPLTTSITGPAASDMTIVAGTDTCTGERLEQGGMCTVSIAFTPTRAGAAQAELSVGGVPGGLVTAGLSGVGVGPAQLVIEPPSRTFGSVATGTTSPPLSFTITNVGGQASSAPAVTLAGTNAGEFSLAGSTCTIALAPGDTCTVAVAFAPTATGNAAAELQIAATTGGTVTSSLAGTGVAPGGLLFLPAAVPFAPLAVGETTTQTLSLVNTGTTTTTTAIDLAVDDAAFTITANTCTILAPGTSCAVTVRLAPTSIGARTGTLTATAGTGGTATAALLATVRPRLELVAINGGPVTSPYDFGEAIIETTTLHDARITVRNNTASTQPFVVTSMFDGQFSVFSNSCDTTDMIAAGGLCTVGVRFAPTTTGAKAGSITFADGSGASNAVTQQLAGTGIDSLVLAALAGTDFGAVSRNTTSPSLRFRVTNPVGSTASGVLATSLSGTSMSIITDECDGVALAAAASCLIEVRFAPTDVGAVTGTLAVAATPGGSRSLTLTATGVDPTGEAPTAIILAPDSITEHAPLGTRVGGLSVIDADGGQTYSYALVGGTGSDDNAAFTIVGSDVNTAAVIDYETKHTYTLRVRVTDSGGQTFEQALPVTILNIDDLPAAENDTLTVGEDSPATALDVLGNDTDVDGGLKMIASVTQGAHGAVAITHGGGILTYEPEDDYTGPDTFTYTLNGGSLATVTVNVTPVDDPPVAVDDSFTIEEDSGATALAVLDNDTDIDEGPRTVLAVTQPVVGQGTAAVGPDGANVTFTPGENFVGTTSFTYTLDGGTVATVTVTTTGVDDPPVAVDDVFTVQEDSAATTLNVTANDTDIDGGPKTVTAVTQPANGTVVLAGGVVTYQPDADYQSATPDAFTYTLEGGSTATVRVTVTNLDDLPTAVDDTVTATEDIATTLAVLLNDLDEDGGTLQVTAVTQPANGTVTINGGGTGVTYTSSLNYCNTPPGTNLDSFTYTVNGGDTATVTVAVTCIDDAPTMITLAPSTVAENQPSGTVVGSLASIDIDSAAFTYALATGTGDTDNAAFTIAGNQVRTAASFDFETKATYAIRVRSTGAGGAFFEQPLMVVVTNANDAPTDITPAAAAVAENLPVGSFVTTLGAVDLDASDTFTFQLVAGAGDTHNAEFSISNNMLRTAALQNREAGDPMRSVRIRVTDSAGLSFERPLAIEVTNVEEAPTTFNIDPLVFSENVSVGYPIATLTSDDPEGNATFAFVAGAGSTDNARFQIAGTTLHAGQVFDWETGQRTFSIRVRATDPTGTSVDRVFTLTLLDDNELPEDADESYPVQANVGISMPAPGLLAGATDGNGGTPQLAPGNYNTAAGGFLILSTNGAFTYRAPSGAAGITDTFQYEVRDGQGGWSTSTVSFQIDTNLIWFVNLAATAPGNGTLASPLTRLPSQLNAPGTVFVYTSDTSTFTDPAAVQGFTLLAGQNLIGEGVTGPAGSTINTYLGFATYPGSLALPTINGPRHAIARRVQLQSGGDRRILDIDLAGIEGTDFATLTVDNVSIKAAGPPMTLSNGTVNIALDSVTGSSAAGFSFSNITGTASVAAGTHTTVGSGHALNINGGGAFTFQHQGTIASTSGLGLTFTATPAVVSLANVSLASGSLSANNATGPITVTGGTISAGGLGVSGESGGIMFGGSLSAPGTVVNINNANGTNPIVVTGNLSSLSTGNAVSIANSSTPVRLEGSTKNFATGGIRVDSSNGVLFRNGGITAGRLVQIRNNTAPIEVSGPNNVITGGGLDVAGALTSNGLTFASVSCTAPSRISLTNVTGGPVSLGGGTCTSTTFPHSAVLSNVMTDVSIATALSGVSIASSGQVDKTMTFSGPITSQPGVPSQIGITNSRDLVSSFTGKVDLTGAGTGSTAVAITDGGLISITGTENQITTGNISLQGASQIGPGGIRLRTFAGGTTNGISIPDAGTLGGFRITGSVASGSGGSATSVNIVNGFGHELTSMTITNPSGVAVTFRDTRDVTLSKLVINALVGVRATNVTKLRLRESTITTTNFGVDLISVRGTTVANRHELAQNNITAGSNAINLTGFGGSNPPQTPTAYATVNRALMDWVLITGPSNLTSTSTTASMPVINVAPQDGSNLRFDVQQVNLVGPRGFQFMPNVNGALDTSVADSSITLVTNGSQAIWGSQVNGNTTYSFTGNTLETSVNSGIHIESFGRPRGIIATNTLHGVVGANSNYGIRLTGGQIVRLDGNTIDGHQDGLVVVGALDLTLRNSSFAAVTRGFYRDGSDTSCLNLATNNINSTGGAGTFGYLFNSFQSRLQGYTTGTLADFIATSDPGAVVQGGGTLFGALCETP